MENNSTIVKISGLCIGIGLLSLWINKKRQASNRLTFRNVHIEPCENRNMNTCSRHGWGFADTRFEISADNHLTMTGSRYPISGKQLPSFIPFIESELGIKIDASTISPALYDIASAPPGIENVEVKTWLDDRFKDNAVYEEADRIRHSHGHTHEDMYNLKHGFERVVDAVIYVDGEKDVRDLMAFANKNDSICMIPFGGGTNVTNALSCSENENRYIVSVDMSRMNQILWIDSENKMAEIQAGAIGTELDKELSKYGFHTGHEPDSNEFSTLGGWISTAASGMKQARYGNIENIVLSVKLITPTGDLVKYEAHPRTSTCLDIKQLIFGSEGNLGIITSATIKLHVRPEVREYDSILFPTFKEGVKFFRHLSETNVVPASIRLVDNRQFRFGQAIKPEKSRTGKIVSALQKKYVLGWKGFDKDTMVACTILYEGDRENVNYQKKVLAKIAPRYGGMFAGAESGKSGYILTYAIAYIRDIGARIGIMAESFETAVPWNKIHDVCNAVQKTVDEQHAVQKINGKPFISWRISQIYDQGVCIYFYYAFDCSGLGRPDQVYSAIEAKCRRAIMDNGGSLSHHHGVGKIRKRFIGELYNDTSRSVAQAIKKSVDPRNIMVATNGAMS